jgi:hypothetical protein
MVSNKCCVSGCSSSRKNGFKLFYVPNGKTPVTYTRSIYLYTVTSNLILGVKNRVRREQWLKKLRLSTNLLCKYLHNKVIK